MSFFCQTLHVVSCSLLRSRTWTSYESDVNLRCDLRVTSVCISLADTGLTSFVGRNRMSCSHRQEDKPRESSVWDNCLY